MPTDRRRASEEPSDDRSRQRPPAPDVSLRPAAASGPTPGAADEKKLPLRRQLGPPGSSCSLITLTVLFPIVWIFSMSVDPRNLSRPDGLNLIPPGRHARRLRRGHQPSRPATRSASSSWRSTASRSRCSARPSRSASGVTAAYAFSRLKFRGRERADDRDPRRADAAGGRHAHPAVHLPQPVPDRVRRLRLQPARSLLGVMPGRHLRPSCRSRSGTSRATSTRSRRDLEEAAAVDGATQNQIFRKVVLPLATPAIAVTGFLGFLGGWTEYLTVVPVHRRQVPRLDAVDRAQQHGRPVRPEHAMVASSRRSRSCSPCRSRWCSSSSSATWSAGSRSAASRAEARLVIGRLARPSALDRRVLELRRVCG